MQGWIGWIYGLKIGTQGNIRAASPLSRIHLANYGAILLRSIMLDGVGSTIVPVMTTGVLSPQLRL
jgi:hypothetical protein